MQCNVNFVIMHQMENNEHYRANAHLTAKENFGRNLYIKERETK